MDAVLLLVDNFNDAGWYNKRDVKAHIVPLFHLLYSNMEWLKSWKNFFSATLTVSCTAPAVDVNFVDILRNYDRFAIPWYSLHEVAKRTSRMFYIVFFLFSMAY